MSHKVNAEHFSDYINSVIKLEELQKMTESLDRELADSQDALMRIKSMFNFLINNDAFSKDRRSPPPNNISEQLSDFFNAETPNFLLPEMSNNMMDLDDLSEVIKETKSVALKLKTEYELLASQARGNKFKYAFADLSLNQYVNSLAELNNRMAHIKIQKHQEINHRNAELEEKLSQLNQDVYFFTKMVEAKKYFSECNKNWKTMEQRNNLNQYETLINKLLSDINEVTYLMEYKN